MAQLTSRTFDTGQLQILTNFIIAPLMTQKLPYGVLFGPGESLDSTSLRMKTEKPSQSHRNITDMINEFLSPNLPPNNGTLWYQQEGATAHTAVISITVFCRLFQQRVISRFVDVPWPPCSPDLTAPDFFLWGYLKSKVHSNCPTDLYALKENIWEEIAKLSDETLQAIMRSFLTHVHLCIEKGGGHLKDIVHKK